MSGTSLDGIDAAIIESDGQTIHSLGPSHYEAYDDNLRARLRDLLDKAAATGRESVGHADTNSLERDYTLAQAKAVDRLLAANGLTTSDIDLVGFHGQTILHRPQDRWTWQMGDGAMLADYLGLPVINDFRGADVRAGGEGAPFAPLYHRALLNSDAYGTPQRPVAVLNIGGVGNVTWFGEGDEILAFDTGPGNALMDDWIRRHTGDAFDKDGALAATGAVHQDRIDGALDNPYFDRLPPKSLDRLDFSGRFAEGLNLADGLATLGRFTVDSIAASRGHMTTMPKAWYVCGGGRKNSFLIRELERVLEVPVEPVERLGWRGDSLEAEAFGFLAIRSLKGLPLSVPKTTGVPQPMTGGQLHRPERVPA